MQVLIVDDDAIVTTALKTIIEQDGEITVAAVGKSGLEAIDLYDKFKPDVLLMDIKMKELNGIEAGREILKKHKDAKILYLTTFDTDEFIIEALKIGAKGYILKQNYDTINMALKLVNNNGRVYGDSVLEKVKLKDQNKKNYSEFFLNEKEFEIIRLVANGFKNKEISNKLFLSEGTVRNYISTVLDILNLRDRTQLAIFYYKNFE